MGREGGAIQARSLLAERFNHLTLFLYPEYPSPVPTCKLQVAPICLYRHVRPSRRPRLLPTAELYGSDASGCAHSHSTAELVAVLGLQRRNDLVHHERFACVFVCVCASSRSGPEGEGVTFDDSAIGTLKRQC